ncbi:MAG: hypothetical protein LUH46_02190, partial [Alistipes sp.]|nr:hypothetical protein [Alistipes sp.]
IKHIENIYRFPESIGHMTPPQATGTQKDVCTGNISHNRHFRPDDIRVRFFGTAFFFISDFLSNFD